MNQNSYEFNSIRGIILSKLVDLAVPSLAVAVAKDGKILWEEGFGWADREKRRLATPHTMYSLASISKPMTATGLMVLKERGLVDLDSPINNYLGEAKLKGWAGDSNEATVRRVANHSSGLPLHYHFFYEDEPYRRPPMDETIRRYGNLVTIPGERYQYSNLGYGLLDYIISRISGRSYPDIMRQEVFLPLGMTRTSVNIGPGLGKYQAIRYGFDGLPIPFYDFDHPGGSAIYSSAHDLVRFGMFHLKDHLPEQKGILSDGVIDEMQKPTMETGIGTGYGIGWAINENNMGYHTISHGGGMGGVSTTLLLIPGEKLAIVVLTNSSTSLPNDICKEILTTMLPEYARNRLVEEARQKEMAEKQGFSKGFGPVGDLIGEWEGKAVTYKGEIPITFWFKESGDIHIKMGEQLKTLLNYASFNDGYLNGRFIGDIGTEDANRRMYHLHVNLRLRGNVLNGAITAISLPGQRMGNALSYWMEIKKLC